MTNSLAKGMLAPLLDTQRRFTTRISCRAKGAFALPCAIPSTISLRRISET